MARLLRAPAFHFLILGAALLAGSRWWEGRRRATPPADGPIVVTADDVHQLRAEWTRDHGVPPGPATEQALIANTVDEEVLYRAALALGLDRQDGGVRERLVRLGDFLGEDEAGNAALERRARQLGLERRDIVIRRHLVQLMRLATGRLGPSDLPTDEELAAYLENHAAEFTEPASVRLVHVYLSRAARGAAAEHDAETLLARLDDTGAGPQAAAARGDAFIHGTRIGPASPADLERLFGSTFASALDEAPLGRWLGPLPSSYGYHLVWLEARTPPHLPSLASVRTQVLLRWQRERSQQLAATRLQALRARYDVAIAPTASQVR